MIRSPQQTITKFLTPAANSGKRKLDEGHQARRIKSLRQDNEFDRNRPGLEIRNEFDELDEEEAPNGDLFSSPRLSRMPPIVLSKDIKNPKDTLKKIRKWAKNMHFKVVRDQHAIITYNKEDYSNIKNKLDEVKLAYFTYTQKSEKTRRLVLKSLPSLYSLEEVQENLIAQSTAVVNVTVLKTKNPSEKNPIYLVSFTWEANVAEVKKSIRYVCDHRVTWQEYMKPKRLRGSQCFRCQRYGHVSQNCHLEQRCVKCSLTHNKGECSKTADESPTCANCLKAHPANYRGCEAAKIYKSSIKPKTAPAVRSTNIVQQRNTNTIKKYSDVLRTHSRQGHAIQRRAAVSTADVTATNYHISSQYINKFSTKNEGDRVPQKNDFSLQSFSNEIFKLFNISFTQLAKEMKKFWANYVNITNVDDQKEAIINFMFHLNANSI